MADSARLRRSNLVAPPARVGTAKPRNYGRPAVILTARRHVTQVPPALREQMIREAAYRRAEARGFESGGELDDWLSAESEVDEIITRRYGY